MNTAQHSKEEHTNPTPLIKYQERFLKRRNMNARYRKSIEINEVHYDLMKLIINVIKDDKISLSDYLHHIISHHFEVFWEDIEDFYNKNYKTLLTPKKQNWFMRLFS